jgi:carboxylesterase type B
MWAGLGWCFLWVLFAAATSLRTPCGNVLGQSAGGVVSFQGIPFGVVHRRFEHSEVAPCWPGTLEARALGPACFQSFAAQGMSEDCLNLNVYVPENASSLLPVLFYVFGGGNTEGTNAQMGVPSVLARELNAVVVVPNYRLGTLGYLVLESAGLTGNYGVGDVIAALRFVRPLLMSFGGDLNQITVMGQSSGGTNILALLASPSAKGLFSAALVLSGSPNITADVQSTSNLHAQYLLPLTGCPLQSDVQVTLSCLLRQTPENLTASSNALMGAPPGFNPPSLPLGPGGNQLIGLVIVDGIIVTMPVLDALAIPLIDVRLWVQSVQCELDPSDSQVDYLPNCASYEEWLAKYLGQTNFSGSSGMAAEVAAAYCPDSSVERAFESLLADMGVTCGNNLVAQVAQKSFRNRVVRSHLTGRPSHEYLDKNYAFHTWDYPILGAQYWGPFSPQDSDLSLSKTIARTWTVMLYNDLNNSSYGDCVIIGDNGTVSGQCENIEKRCQLLTRLGLAKPEFWWVN